MTSRKTGGTVRFVISGMVLFCMACPQLAAQNVQRGYNTRGINRPGAQRMGVTPRYTRPMSSPNVPSVLRGAPVNANPGGPLGFDYTPLISGPGIYFDAALSGLGVDPGLAADMGLLEGAPITGGRPSVRPRLDITDRDAMSSTGVLGRIRATVTSQIAGTPETPFSPQWYAAHASVVPISTTQSNAWSAGSWTDVAAWLNLDAAQQRYDFRPDSRGLIYVYHNQLQRGRAVDARAEAITLANTAPPAANESPGLSLGVFAAVPPVDAPVRSLVHLVLNKSGAVTGYQYQFAGDSVEPVQGMVDPVSQQVAWKMGSTVMQAGVGNLTDEAARALVFRDDGWTQAWILLRIAELPEELVQPKRSN